MLFLQVLRGLISQTWQIICQVQLLFLYSIISILIESPTYMLENRGFCAIAVPMLTILMDISETHLTILNSVIKSISEGY